MILIEVRHQTIKRWFVGFASDQLFCTSVEVEAKRFPDEIRALATMAHFDLQRAVYQLTPVDVEQRA